MHYTTTQQLGSLHFQRITPLNSDIVRLDLTVRIPKFGTTYKAPHIALYSALVSSGTKKKSKKAMETFLKKHGIQFSVSARGGYIQFSITTRLASLDFARVLLNEVLYSPRRDLSEFKSKISLFLEENRESKDNAKRIAEINFYNLLYPKHSYPRALTLTEERACINTITLNSLSDLERDLLSGEWYVSIVGSNVAEKKLLPLITKISATAKEVQNVVLAESGHKTTSLFATVPGKTNIELRLGNVLPITPHHPAYRALEFGMAVLGKVGGFSGRLMSTIREKEGLTYGIYASLVETQANNTVHWNIFTFFTARDLEKGIQSIKRELQKIVAKGITTRELSVFKEIFENQFLLAHESNLQRLHLYQTSQVMGYSETDLIDEIQAIRSLTVSEVNNALRTFLNPNNLVVSGAGPVTQKGKGIVKE